MRGFVLRISATVACLLLLVSAVFAQAAAAEPRAVTSTEMIEQAKALDGQEVIYTGEAIGEVMARGDHAWVNVSDGANAIGLWLDANQASQIRTLGSYSFSGDRVTVSGVFHRACAEHGGDMDVHVSELSVVTQGTATAHPVKRDRIGMVALMVLLAVCLGGLDLLRGRRLRREALRDQDQG